MAAEDAKPPRRGGRRTTPSRPSASSGRARSRAALPSEQSGTPQNCGVINPYALAESVTGRRINWAGVADAPRLLEQVLGTPYAELFDPVHEGPLYVGLKLTDDLRLERVRSDLFDIDIPSRSSDLSPPLSADAVGLARLADLAEPFGTEDVGSIKVARSHVSGSDVVLALRLPRVLLRRRLASVLQPQILRTISFDPTASPQDDWTPPNAAWLTGGRFFNEATEFSDPVQGSVANCYFIAALSAVAWAVPKQIRHINRATGLANDLFTDTVTFYRPDSGGVTDHELEVTEAVPMSGGNYIYCRSSEVGETWPAVYEKAFAKLKTGTQGDRPDITATAWGDSVYATSQLTGGYRAYRDTANLSAHDLWQFVRQHSLGGRTFAPMTAWTYSTGDASDKKIVYSDANIVASHAYTVLGWDYKNGQEYLILRNPWGSFEPSVGVLAGVTLLQDISWWRPIDLGIADGTFGIEANTFKTYFAGIGVVT